MLMLLTTANVINATLYQNLNYDLMRDIVPVASIDNEPFVFEVNPSFPAKTLQEFIAYAKANPSKVTMASAGIGSAPHIFAQKIQGDARNPGSQQIPYRGNPIPDVIGGQVDCFIGPVQSALEFIRDRQIACARPDDRAAVRRFARRAADCQCITGLRSRRLARHRRAQGHAVRRHCAP